MKSVVELLDHVRPRVSTQPQPAQHDAIRRHVSAFQTLTPDKDADLNIFTFHAHVPDSHRRIAYVDVKHDHHAFDYPLVNRHFIDTAVHFNPKVRIIFVTDETTPAPPPHPRLAVVRLQMDTRGLMFERVRTMAAYTNSPAFDRNTVFLDTDAFPNSPLGSIFDGTFDVGVTWRDPEGFYMPLNEGVIFASHDRPDQARRFFDTYLATYLSLIADPATQAYYGDIKRWRGGQLSLNATWDHYMRLVSDGCLVSPRVNVFPCDSHNFWVEPDASADPALWNQKHILHLKGDSKWRVSQIMAYHSERLGITA